MPAKAKQSKVAARKAVRTQLAQAASNNNKVQQSKANAAQTAQPGVIGSIIALLVDAKHKSTHYTFAYMHEQLQAQHPSRRASGLAITLRAQLSRLPVEKDVLISKQRDGRITKYAAA
jgi:hypothetical protein